MKKIVKRLRKLTGYKPKIKTKAIPHSAIRKANKSRKRSSIELLIYKWLDEEGIKFKKEKVIGRCHVDIFIEPNIALEVQGCYFHKCKECFPKKTKENLEIRMRDTRRFAFFRNKGYKVVTIWEHEIRTDPERIKQILRFLDPKLG